MLFYFCFLLISGPCKLQNLSIRAISESNNINNFAVTNGAVIPLNTYIDFSECDFVSIYVQSPYKSLYSNLQPVNNLGRYNFTFGEDETSTKNGVVDGVVQGSWNISISGISTSRISQEIAIIGYKIV